MATHSTYSKDQLGNTSILTLSHPPRGPRPTHRSCDTSTTASSSFFSSDSIHAIISTSMWLVGSSSTCALCVHGGHGRWVWGVGYEGQRAAFVEGEVGWTVSLLGVTWDPAGPSAQSSWS